MSFARALFPSEWGLEGHPSKGGGEFWSGTRQSVL